MLYQIKEAADKRLRREKAWQGICVHHTGLPKDTSENALIKFSKNILSFLSAKDDSYVSAHYVISIGGIITQLVDPDTHEAYHAGVSSWYVPTLGFFQPDMNRYMIGIELVGDGNLLKYTDAQYASLIELTKHLMNKYPTIHPLCIVGHEHISIGRKVDPGKYFELKRFFQGIYKV
jgi:AmpD protein